MYRLILLMGMGLGALYMMHLLAQDYNKIRRPVAAAATRAFSQYASASASTLLRGKRNAVAGKGAAASSSDYPATNATLPVINWKRILSRDPFECLQSLICQLMSGAESESQEALTLMSFIETTLNVAPAKIGRAFSRGLSLRGQTERCFDEYFCLYSAKTMLRVLKWFSDAGYAEAGSSDLH